MSDLSSLQGIAAHRRAPAALVVMALALLVLPLTTSVAYAANDERAVALAETLLDAMGGREAFDATPLRSFQLLRLPHTPLGSPHGRASSRGPNP